MKPYSRAGTDEELEQINAAASFLLDVLADAGMLAHQNAQHTFNAILKIVAVLCKVYDVPPDTANEIVDGYYQAAVEKVAQAKNSANMN